ncbi:oxidoreductase [Sphaerisporangium sp. TRM90804]|uniref:WD40/YVTN/BNR-like repeat-containing protein n=1 Tax=Sphaerisporangium sp. TRM90804 TaxID=3031113 RepID=UPI00244B1F85|nr:oxidoreductase [Sphaerisporangium sp. TRM90804]MDH2429460.1 oxidoreductase [Sphaerisporangium sp. TRM90804]
MRLRSVFGMISAAGVLLAAAPAAAQAHSAPVADPPPTAPARTPPSASTSAFERSLSAGGGPPAASVLTWEPRPTGVTARLRGLSPVSRDVAWTSGSAGTVLRTTDGGRRWRNVSPPGVADLQFRDVEAFDARTAVALSIGEGELSRVYRTDDGGGTWAETFRNDEPRAFYDCLAFFDRRHGLAMSDPVDGRFRILSTDDGGRTWRVLPSSGMPEALPGEAGFAASGQCLVTAGRNDVWMATGGAARSRVFHSADRGRTWTVADTTIPAGDPARGVFALAFRTPRDGIAVGGDFQPGLPSPDAAATTADGGRTWRTAATPPEGYRSGVTWLPYLPFAAIAVGPTGSDLTLSGGRHWQRFDTGSFDTVACTPDLSCWASGEQGRVARLALRLP